MVTVYAARVVLFYSERDGRRSGRLERPRVQYFPSTNGANIGYGESLYRNGGAFTGHELHLRDTPIPVQVRDYPDIAGNNTAGCNVSRDYDRV